jgi:putative acyl-CoA dehydrogenase
MGSVLADLALESQAATVLALRLAGAADRAGRGDEAQRALLRVALPAAKYWVCKRTPAHAAEALECLGGNGYVEESGMPRLYREAPLNSIWEGSGNVTALDVLRALARTPGCADALLAELDLAAGGDRRLDTAVGRLRQLLAGLETATSLEAQYGARRLAGLIAVAMQAALLVRHLPGPLADAFCGSRLGSAAAGGPGAPFGTLPDGLDVAAIIDRARVSARG